MSNMDDREAFTLECAEMLARLGITAATTVPVPATPEELPTPAPPRRCRCGCRLYAPAPTGRRGRPVAYGSDACRDRVETERKRRWLREHPAPHISRSAV